MAGRSEVSIDRIHLETIRSLFGELLTHLGYAILARKEEYSDREPSFSIVTREEMTKIQAEEDAEEAELEAAYQERMRRHRGQK